MDNKQEVRKGFSIELFEVGARVERVEPIKYPSGQIDNTLYTKINGRQRNLIYQGIKEGKIHILEKAQKGKEHLWKLDFPNWENGWTRYEEKENLEAVNPENLVDKKTAKKFLEGIIYERYIN